MDVQQITKLFKTSREKKKYFEKGEIKNISL